MLKKDITYKNVFTDEEITETFYFYLSEADLIDLEATYSKNGFGAAMQEAIDTEDRAELYQIFRNLILRSYTRKSQDGNRPIKTPEMRVEFEASPAYSRLLMDMITDADFAAKFVSAIMPANLDADLEKIMAAQKAAEQNGSLPTTSPEAVTPTTISKAQAVDMDADELQSGLATGRYVISSE